MFSLIIMDNFMSSFILLPTWWYLNFLPNILGVLKKEDPNVEENVLNEIKIDEKEEPVGKIVTSDNLEMSDM